MRDRSEPTQPPVAWLRTYAFTRAAVSAGWVALAFAVGTSTPLAAILLVAYPAWDALANYVDARRSGGLSASPSQTLNVAVSGVTTLGVLVAVVARPFSPLVVFGTWAILAGLLQLATGVRRWRAGGQWPMVLSGVQSAVAGVLFFQRASLSTDMSAAAVAPYAAFGAFYFLVSAVWLSVRNGRRGPVPTAG